MGSNPALGMLYRTSGNRKVMLHIHMNAGRQGSVKGPLPDDRPGSVPALELNKRGRVKCRSHIPFARSQHREYSRRRADTKKKKKGRPSLHDSNTYSYKIGYSCDLEKLI